MNFTVSVYDSEGFFWSIKVRIITDRKGHWYISNISILVIKGSEIRTLLVAQQA